MKEYPPVNNRLFTDGYENSDNNVLVRFPLIFIQSLPSFFERIQQKNMWRGFPNKMSNSIYG